MTAVGFYKRPSLFRRRVYDPLIRMLVLRVGFAGFLDPGGKDSVQVLAVRGRRTGRWHRRPVGVSIVQGVRYVVGFYGQTQWARNLRAGCEASLQTHGGEERVRAVELAGVEKTEFMRHLVARYRFFARVWLKVNPKRVTEEDLRRLVADYPVFRLKGGGRSDMRP